MRRALPRVVVAGQLPPPLSGQHLAVSWNLEELRADGRFVVEHLPFRFAEDMEGQGRASAGKVVELVRIVGRLAGLRRHGRIDLLLYPMSGTSAGAALRDVALVGASRLLVGRTVLRFHGAGHRSWADDDRPVIRASRRVLGGAGAAVVHAEANRVDAEVLGIADVHVLGHRIDDTLERALVQRDHPGEELRIAYIGHLGAQRSTDELLGAVAALAADGVSVRLELGGNPTGDYSFDALRARAADLGIADRVVVHGPVDGDAKRALLGRAHLFAFPTVFASESFGIVLAEALCWGLPVVASDWRANAEVLDGADAEIHACEPDLRSALTAALHAAAGHLADGTWPTFSERNRAVYEARYRRALGPASPLGDVVATVLARRG